MNKAGRYFWNIVQAVDRLLNAIMGGTDKEYLSSRIYRYREKTRVAALLYCALNKIDTNHCEKAFIDAQIGYDPNDAVLR